MKSVYYNKREIQIYTVILTLLLLVKSLNQIMIAYFPALAGMMMSLLYLALDIGLILLTIAKGRVIPLKYNILITFLLAVAYIISKVLLHRTDDNILYLITYVFVPLLFAWNFDVDYKLFFKISLMIPLLGIPVLSKMFTLRYGTIEMGTSYAFLFVSIVPIVYLFKVKEKSKLLIIVAVIDLAYTAQIFLYGARGCVLSVAVCVVAIAFTSYYDRVGFKRNTIKSFIFVLALVIFLICYRQLFDVATNILGSIGISPYFLKKIIRLGENTGVLNGRDSIYGLTLDYIKNKPLVGYGFDSFDYYTGLDYPHNFLLQFLFDFGIIGTLLVMVPFIRGQIKHLIKCTYNEYIVFLVIFVATIPGALFSGNVWNNMGLWVIISYSYHRCFMRSYDNHEEGE